MWLWLFNIGWANTLDACFVDPDTPRDAYRCAYRVARTTTDYDAVVARVSTELDAHPSHAWAVHTLGSLLTDQGKIVEGVEYFERARTMFDDNGDVLGQVYSRLNLGTHLAHLARPVASQEAYEQAARIASKNDRKDLEHAAKLSLARGLVRERRDLGTAWEAAIEVEREIFPKGDYQTQLLALHVLQRIALITGRTDERLGFLERQVSLSVDANDQYTIASAQADVAETLTTAHSIGHAPDGETLERVRSLVAELQQAGNHEIAGLTLCMLSQIEDQHHHTTQSIQAATECLQAAKKFDSAIDRGSAEVSLSFALTTVDAKASDAHWSTAMDLTATENDRAGLALEKLELLGKRQDLVGLEQQLTKARAAAQLLRDAAADANAEQGLAATSLKFLEMAAHYLAQERPTLSLELAEIGRGHPPDLQLPAFQDQIPNDTSLVVYVLPRTFDEGIAHVITRGEHRVVPLPGVLGIDRRIASWIGLIRARDAAAGTAGRSLHALLVEPLHLSTEVVVLLPTGALHGLPFSALQDTSGVRMGDVHRLTRTPSIIHWLRPTTTDAPANSLLIADPIDADQELPRLPAAQIEIQKVRTTLGGKATVLVGAQATEAAVRAQANADWIHIAAHAVVNDRFPDRTAIHLANGDRLTEAEIGAMRWDHSVVVLSSCRSAGGAHLGNSPVSLTRAFIEGGAATTIGSLWPMRDDEALQFFERMYSHIGRGERLDLALTQTRRELAHQGLPAEAWAGVVLLGDGQRSLPPRAKASWWWIYAAGGATTLLGFVLIWRRETTNGAPR